MDVTWDPPGPGQWAIDMSHMPAGCTRITQELMSPAMRDGSRRMLAELGAPLECIDLRFVNGFTYTRVRPLVGGDRTPRRPPPLPVLKLAMRLHPEMRRRAATSARVLEQEPWKQVIHDWHHGTKSRIEAGNLALQDVDLAALDDAAVLDHARACLENCARNFELHFWLHGYDMGPLGQYLFEAQDWGIDAGELLSLLEGASPSTSGPSREAAAIREMVAAAGAEPATLDELRAVSPDVSSAVDRYLRRRAWVLFSRYDVDGVTLGERPDLVLASIMAGGERDTPAAEVARRTADVRARVPEAHRARFDEVLAQARDAMDLRDDNGPTTAEWPAGLLRRALLDIGRRMVASGVADDAALACDLAPAELSAAHRIDDLPSGDELRRRRDVRDAQRRLDPPRRLGPDEPPPPLDALPPAMRRLVAMVQVVMAHMGMDGAAGGNGLQGAGIGTARVTGRACVAASPEEALDRLEPGDVLVVAATTPAYNLVLSIAGAVVTSEGGPMSHAAVIARELGIPAVIGARAALVDIPDGATVEVDAAAGEVRLVARA